MARASGRWILDPWVAVIHPMEDIKESIAALNSMPQEFGRENKPFDIMMHCPNADTIDDIRRLEDMGVTDLQVMPWTGPGSVKVEEGVPSSMQQQPSLSAKLDDIKRYADQVITRFC